MTTEEYTEILKYLKSKGITQKNLAHDFLVRTEQALIKYKKGDEIPDLVERKILSVFREEAARDVQEAVRALIEKRIKKPEDIETLRQELENL